MKLGQVYVFISYQTNDKQVAGQLKTMLSKAGIQSFLAHEDIEVSNEWRLKILEEIGKADIFICLLSCNYSSSAWCVQEAGIAAFLKPTIIPLSIDEKTIPAGFISNIQSVKLNPLFLSLNHLVPGFVQFNLNVGIELIIFIIGKSGSYRSTSENFKMLDQYLDKLTDEQAVTLLEYCKSNQQIYKEGTSAATYIPKLLKHYCHLLSPMTAKFLEKACSLY
jgi:hypothetical protein